jgi:hypothetical protein
MEPGIAQDQKGAIVEAAQTLSADLWPRVENEVKTFRNQFRSKNWYLVLTNRGDGKARDIRIKTEPITDGKPWNIVTGRDEGEPDVELLGGSPDNVWLPISAMQLSAGVVRCIVTWTDDRGEHSNTATLQLK